MLYLGNGETQISVCRGTKGRTKSAQGAHAPSCPQVESQGPRDISLIQVFKVSLRTTGSLQIVSCDSLGNCLLGVAAGTIWVSTITLLLWNDVAVGFSLSIPLSPYLKLDNL